MHARVHVSGLLAALAIACGGNVFSQGDVDGSGAKGSAGSSSGGVSNGGTSSKAGSPGKAGTSTGGSPSAGSTGMGGAVLIGGGPNCEAVDCAFPVCEDGSKPIVPPGSCCPICPSTTGCEGLTCEPVTECEEGYVLSRPPGACCTGCIQKPGGVACREIACPSTSCPVGFVRGDVLGGCCYDCLPDPSYCNEAADCVIADKPRSCCGCPEAISRRQFAEDPCWSEVGVMRAIPVSCYPQAICDAACRACPLYDEASCVEHRCTPHSRGLK
jgi:hypothetical protein